MITTTYALFLDADDNADSIASLVKQYGFASGQVLADYINGSTVELTGPESAHTALVAALIAGV